MLTVIFLGIKLPMCGRRRFDAVWSKRRSVELVEVRSNKGPTGASGRHFVPVV